MIQLTPDINNIPQQLKNHSGWFVAIGAVLIVLGFFALSYQLVATEFSVFFIGILLFLAGLSQAVHSFKLKSYGQTTLWAVMGALYMIAGIISITQPLEVSVAFTLILSFLLIVSGITQLISAMNNKNYPKWGWWIFSGFITLLLGVMILAGWPTNSFWILGLFLGIDLIFQGWAYVVIGIAIKSAKSE